MKKRLCILLFGLSALACGDGTPGFHDLGVDDRSFGKDVMRFRLDPGKARTMGEDPGFYESARGWSHLRGVVTVQHSRDASVWFRFRVTGRELERNPVVFAGIYGRLVESLELYQDIGGGRLSLRRNGSLYSDSPFVSKLRKGSAFFTLKASGPYVLHGSSRGHLRFLPRFGTLEQLLSQGYRARSLWFLAIGVCAVLLFLHFFFYYSIRDRASGSFLIYLATVMLLGLMHEANVLLHSVLFGPHLAVPAAFIGLNLFLMNFLAGRLTRRLMGFGFYILNPLWGLCFLGVLVFGQGGFWGAGQVLLLKANFLFVLSLAVYLVFMSNSKSARFLLVSQFAFLVLYIYGLYGKERPDLIGEPSLFYALVLQAVFLAPGLAERLGLIRKRLGVLNRQLEEKVTQRTGELEASLGRARELAEKQDGDYFLTSLLLEPFQKDHNLSRTVRSQLFIEQYKKFSYQKWRAELGGDLCLIDNVKLNGRGYVVFVNADAMGKSMQGAGGILVFASLLKSLILETVAKNDGPEAWLCHIYGAMDSVFRTFNGGMLISAIIGLLDESSGELFYLNLEHPTPVVLSGARAAFINNCLEMEKLGSAYEDAGVLINHGRLKTGDMLILGSDGREDLFQRAQGSEPELATDVLAFPDFVERAQGDVRLLADFLKASGEIRDDLSLLSLEFLGDEESEEDEKSWVGAGRQYPATAGGRIAGYESLISRQEHHTEWLRRWRPFQ